VIHRGTDATPDDVTKAVEDVVALRHEIIVAWSTVVSRTTPVVFLAVGFPIEIGLVASLARPGGNITGITAEATAATYAKRLQMLSEIVPRLSRLALLYAPGDANADWRLMRLQARLHPSVPK
jgi:putative tryptophan/tyrosine transport system substrate-binding protein